MRRKIQDRERKIDGARSQRREQGRYPKQRWRD